MKRANEIAAELLMIESRSKGELMEQAAAVIMGKSHIIDQLLEEVEAFRQMPPAGHPANDYERLRRAADILGGYCATHACDACPLSPACRGMGMALPKMLDTVAETVEKPILVERFASKR